MLVYFNLKNGYLTSPMLKISIGRKSLSCNYHYVLYFILFLRYQYSPLPETGY